MIDSGSQQDIPFMDASTGGIRSTDIRLLRFDSDAVAELWEHAKSAKSHQTLYDEETGPGLHLVKDEGVYLLSNGLPHMQSRRNEHNDALHVVYAEGLNPHTRDSSEVYDEARRIMGGDDGVNFVEASVCERFFAEPRAIPFFTVGVCDEYLHFPEIRKHPPDNSLGR